MFRRYKAVFSRFRASLLIALLVSSLLTLFTPMFSSTASALNADDVLNRAKAWSILNAIIDMRGLVDSTISSEDANNCHIFGFADNDRVYVGSHVTGDNDVSVNGALDGATWDSLEDNVPAANNALASVGIQGGCRGLLEKIGYTFQDGDLRQPGDFGDKLSERIRNAVNPDAFFGARIGDNGPGDALAYAIAYYNLTKVCGWEFRNAYDPSSQTVEGSRSREAQSNGWSGINDGKHYYTYTYEQGKTGDNVYFKAISENNDVNVGSKSGFAPNGNNDAEVDCGDNGANTFGSILHEQNGQKYANAYANLLKPGGAYNPGTCKDRYDGKPAELAACDAGFKNKATPNYCQTTYPDATLRDACLYGAGTATGGADTTTPPPGSETTDTVGNKTTCAIDAIGWILCPILNLLSSLTDEAYKFIGEFLEVQPLFTTGDTQGIYQAWQVMRNFANVVFVIVFLVIIFSQVTSVGVSNYGIKKMLPRLIIAAILVNISYWICAVAVDISNILGASVKALFDSIGANIPQVHSSISTGSGWIGVVGGLLGGALIGAALYVALAALIPLLGLAAVAVLFTFLALIIRQVLIVLLVVVSPLAFVMFLLPNTQPLFRRWRVLFQTLLLLYPIVGLVYGAGALAGVIISAGAS